MERMGYWLFGAAVGKGWVEGLGEVGVGRVAEESSHRIT
jgi:hypothetical protein